MGRIEYREEPCKTALNRVQNMMFKWSLNPYMGCVHRCTFCYVRAFEKMADRASGDLYGSSIRVKTNVASVLARELARDSWAREDVAIGSATDPYQPAEGRYKLTRQCIVELGKARTPIRIITRGPMIMRDVDVLADAAKFADVHVTFSIPTLDDEIWRKTEHGTAHPRQRLRAIRRLTDAGISTGVGMAPILPGITDDIEGMRAVALAARDAGATNLWANMLYLKPGTREHFLEALARDFPEQLEQYRAMYGARAYRPNSEIYELKNTVKSLAREADVRDRRVNPILPELQLSLI